MLSFIGMIGLPAHAGGGFDHGDVHQTSGRVYVAHTANDSVEVVDGVGLKHITTIPGCTQASGVLCAQSEGQVFAAARGAGKVLVIDASQNRLVSEMSAGSRPNGLAWDSLRRHLLVADVEDNQARFLDPDSGNNLGAIQLRGRPRWCSYDRRLDIFLVNIRDPAGVCVISPGSMLEKSFIAISVPGPHGLDVVEGAGHAFVACDEKAVIALDFLQNEEVASIPIAGEPDVIWYNSGKKRLYCAIAKPGVIDVIDTGMFGLIEQVVTEEGVHTLAFDASRQRLYAFLPRTHRVAVYSEV